MLKTLDSILAQMEALKVSEILKPKCKVPEGAVVIADIGHETGLQKLYTLMMKSGDEMAAFAKKLAHEAIEVIGNEHDSATCPNCQKVVELTQLEMRNKLLHTMFWTELKLMLSKTQLSDALEKGGGLTLCEGWKLVAEEQESPLLGFEVLSIPLGGLGELFGSRNRRRRP